MLRVLEVQHRSAYQLRIRFSDRAVKDVDLAGELYGEVFEPLRDPSYFRQVRVNPDTGTIEWPNGADFAPEYLYELGDDVARVG